MIRSREQQGQELEDAEPSRNAESNKEEDRRPKREINKPYYLKDFIDSNEDTWWKADVRETKEELAARGRKFMNWLGTRKEEIAIVTDRALLFHTLSAFVNHSHPLEKKELSKPQVCRCLPCSYLLFTSF
ncbi:Phosphoglycerate mutase-like protein 1 [Glycine soja]